jgi:hypothetical protein
MSGKRWWAGIHEAGHVITGLALGYDFTDVVARRDGSGLVKFFKLPEVISIKSRRTVCEARRVLVVDVAGAVAETLCEEWNVEGRWLTTKERIDKAVAKARKSPTCTWTEADAAKYVCPYTVSSQLRQSPRDETLQSDIAQTLRKADALALFSWNETRLTALRAAGVPAYDVERHPPLPPFSKEDILAEVMRAERRAEDILKNEIRALEAIAYALCRKQKGTMTREEVEQELTRCRAERRVGIDSLTDSCCPRPTNQPATIDGEPKLEVGA